MTRICDKTGVPFDEAVVQPSRAAGVAHGEKLPLVIWFAGLGQQGFDGLPPDALEPQAPAPFLMLAPRRSEGKTWFITDDRQWGWLDGDFDSEELERIVAWIGVYTCCYRCYGETFKRGDEYYVTRVDGSTDEESMPKLSAERCNLPGKEGPIIDLTMKALKKLSGDGNAQTRRCLSEALERIKAHPAVQPLRIRWVGPQLQPVPSAPSGSGTEVAIANPQPLGGARQVGQCRAHPLGRAQGIPLPGLWAPQVSLAGRSPR